MDLYQWNAFSEGAALRRKDDLASLVQNAFLHAYWNNKKNPMRLSEVLKDIYGEEHSEKAQAKKPDVDVDAFLERKRRFGLDG